MDELILNQRLVVAIATLLGATMLGESYRACEAASLELPGFTEWYFVSVGPVGLMLAGCVSVAVCLAAVGLRRQIAGIVVNSGTGDQQHGCALREAGQAVDSCQQ